MNRLEFIRRSILAAAGVALLPSLVVLEKLPPLRMKKTFMFKVSNEMMRSNPKLFEDLLKENIAGLPSNKGNLISTEIGFVNDDFVKSLQTIKLTFA